MQKKKLPLLAKIVIAIALGIACGFFFPMWATRLFVTFDSLFSAYLSFIVPLLIVGFVAPSIAETGRRAGKMLLATAALAYGFTLMTGFIAYGTSSLLFPSMIKPDQYIASVDSGIAIEPYFTMDIVPLMGVLTSLVLAFVLGLGASCTDSPVINKGLCEFREIIVWAISKSLLPLLPLYIFGIFLDMTVAGKVGPILSTFAKIIVVIFCLHIFILILEYCIGGAVARKNPFKSLWGMMPAYFTALGTSSSAATIPVTLKRAIAIGIDKDVAGFTIPLCATIHMSGSTLKLVACSMAIMILNGLPIQLDMYAGFIAMLGVTIIAAPGVPGGAIMASLGLLSSMLGFTDELNALMIALYIAMDSFGTACNVTGDGAIAMIIDRFFANKKPQSTAETSLNA